MWAYAAAILAGVLLVLGLGRSHAKRKRATDTLGVGKLSDAWLAEQRGSRNQD